MINVEIRNLSSKTAIKNTLINKKGDASFSGKNDSLESFFNDFVKDRLIKKDILVGWHNMLMEYVDLPNNTLFVRRGNKSGSLRRGWMTKYVCNNESFNVIFTDNDLGVSVYKMALDEYVPTTKEFYEALTTFRTYQELSTLWKTKRNCPNEIDEEKGVPRKFLSFPVHFLKSGGEKNETDKLENKMNAAIISGISCDLGTLGYKHAHIFNTGANFLFNDKIINMKEIIDSYITIKEDDYHDYIWDDSICNYVRTINVTKERFDELKQIAIASTLRFIDPLNHFLAPKDDKNFYENEKKKITTGVAEYEVLTSYIANYNYNTYSSLINFDNYYKKAMINFKYEDKSKKPFHIMYIVKDGNYKTKEKNSSNKTEVNVRNTPNQINNTLENKTKPKSINKKEDLKVIYIFLTNKYSLNKLGYKYLNDKVDNHGNKAKYLLDKYGVKNNRKGVLLTKTLEEEINDASGIYKETLLKIKELNKEGE